MRWTKQLTEGIKKGLCSWLNITPANPYTIQINEIMDFELNAIRNRIWYRGDGNELEQLYQQSAEYADRHKFWASKCTSGMEMRKIHTGLPALIVRVLSSIVINDMDKLEFSNPMQEEQWKEMEKENHFSIKLEKSLKESLYIGDGAFKVTIDTRESENPILEWYSGEKIEIIKKYDRIKEVIFKTAYSEKKQIYVLHEHYGNGYIRNELYRGDNLIPLNSIEATQMVKDYTFDERVMLAIPFQIYESTKYEGRGGSIFDGKLDSFDAFDETWSQWMDALRAGRAKIYIPDSLIPRNPMTGEILSPNSFDNRYVKSEGDMSENAQNKIDMEQPAIPHDSYLASYVTALDLCLQGLISPSTLGIDVKKLDNAEAQREKEKTTLYTRDSIITAMQDTIPKVIEACLHAYSLLYSLAIEEVEVNVQFGEYSNPSFESQVETVSKAKQGGIMSIERVVETLYGDTLDDHCKQEEIVRLKAEQGIAEMEEPSVNLEGVSIEEESEQKKMNLLNGAQIGSLMNVIKMVKEGSVTRREAISIITATLGISRENAESFIEEGMQRDSESKQSDLSNEPKEISGTIANRK